MTIKEKTSLHTRIGGLPGGSEAFWLWQNRKALGQTLVLAPSEDAAETLYEDLVALARWRDPDEPAAALFSEDDPGEQAVALSRWTAAAPETPAPFFVTAWENIKMPLPPSEAFRKSHERVRIGDRKDRDAFLGFLGASRYARVDTVEQIGEYAVRGEVVDVWPPDLESPVRLLWPFDQIESIRKIDLATQRSTDAVDPLLVRPASVGKNPLDPTAEEPSATLLDYLAKDGTLFCSQLPEDAEISWPGRRYEHAELGALDVEERFQAFPPLGTGPARAKAFAENVRNWLADGWRLAVFCHNQGELERLEEILFDYDRALMAALEDGRIQCPIGGLTRGFLDPQEKSVVAANAEIFERYKRRLRLPKFTGGKSLAELSELSRGDYVVHERFGIGRYRGLERVKTEDHEGDYLKLEYRGGDRVFVPLFEFRQVQKYIGAEGKKPKLSSLDTAAWERTKAEVQESIAELARELIARAAKRATLAGTAYPPDSHMEREFAASFLYDLTPDQAKAIDDVKKDMARPQPMDRLICGDVGYGKTEVAMRAAFKAVTAEKQVVVLVPTTILAEQHGRNFRDRFADYPVSIAVLSRFSGPEEQKTVIRDLKRGVVDIVIGTHRLLSPDVMFKNLGLIIVDEEHRFGVKQKERLMAFRDVVDVLTLSATPIPRTLGAALGGVKGLSVIQTPPEGRQPINTHVGPYDENLALSAIEHELRRGGQVFYVHNRVSSIERRRSDLTAALHKAGLPARIGLGHGQMSGPVLEKTMWEFLHKKYDILLSTSIIESGLDIPSVNTLIIEEAEDFGLAQLYQLRGRVGRQKQKAYCYLFYSPHTALAEDARKRLGALKEFASLGSGFRLALRDLEIRGAGNLLGPQQHGFVNAVGLDLYGQLLSEEIEKVKGEGVARKPKAPDVALELPVAAYIPEDYVPSEGERVVFYKRLLSAEPGELDALKEEWIDRCGALPGPAQRLFDVAALRHEARRHKVSKIEYVREGLELLFEKDTEFAQNVLQDLLTYYKGRFAFIPGPPFGMRLEGPFEADIIAASRSILKFLPSFA